MQDPEAVEEVARVIAARDLAHWRERFSSIDACVEPVLSPSAARSHPQAVHRGASSEFSLPFIEGAAVLGPAPFLGQHTEEVFAELG
jgi:crotonobetainyl-CoA:carnitine CoA-transferase CaiB-like acyl-CoA transferase